MILARAPGFGALHPQPQGHEKAGAGLVLNDRDAATTEINDRSHAAAGCHVNLTPEMCRAASFFADSAGLPQSP